MAPTLKSLPRTRSGKTLSLALTLLGVVALVQLLVLAGYLIGGGVRSHRGIPVDAGQLGRPVEAVNVPPTPTVRPGLVATTPAPSTPAPASAAETPAPSLALPTPARAPRAIVSPTDLLEQARQLRSRGDMNSALARLREAQVAEPENPQIVAEMALTYEAMQLPDRAFEQWQRLYNMGDTVGALYYLAQSKLQTVPATPAPPVAKAEASPGSVPEAGPQADAILKLTDIHLETVQDPAAEQKISLRIVVKNKPGTAIDPTKVRILTYFYDLVDGKDIVLTDAQTAFAWLTPGRIDWANDKSEILETTYTRLKASPTSTPAPEATPTTKRGKSRSKTAAATPTPSPTATPTPAPVRTYLGYTVRLYYDRQLQDVQADPVRLLQQFPPPMTLSAD